MIRNLISRLLRLEPTEQVEKKIQTLMDFHQKELLGYKLQIENQNLEITLLNEQLESLKSQIIDPNLIQKKDVIIDELRNTIALFEEMLADDNFASNEQRKKYYETKEKSIILLLLLQTQLLHRTKIRLFIPLKKYLNQNLFL